MEVVFKDFAVVQKQNEIKTPTKTCGSFLLFLPHQLGSRFPQGRKACQNFDLRIHLGFLSSSTPPLKASQNELKFQQDHDCNTF